MKKESVIHEITAKLPELIQIIASDPIESRSSILKIHYKPVSIKNVLFLQQISFKELKTFTKNIQISDIPAELNAVFDLYRQFLVRFSTEEIHLFHHADGSWKQKRKQIGKPLCISHAHNRKKNTLIEEGRPLLFLQELGIMKADGTVIAAQRAKFVQINRFLEIVRSSLHIFPREKHLTIYDFGCGKAYLTFSLCHLLLHEGWSDFSIVGIDRKSDVMAFCSDLVKRLGWHGLRFEEGSIHDTKPHAHVNMVIALHACDTATDDTLFQAVNWGAEAIFVAPCCHQELIQKIAPSTLPALLQHGLIRERMAALLTDAMRSRILEIQGYNVDCIEFVDLEHTPKNLLIRAEKKKRGDPSALLQECKQEYKELKDLFQLEPKLGRLLLEKT